MKHLLVKILTPLYWRMMNRWRDHQVESSLVQFKAKLGRKVIVRRGSEVGNGVQIGDYSYISGPRAYVEAAVIGKFCSIARQTTIGASDHDHSIITTHPFVSSPLYGLVDRPHETVQKPAPVIGHDVWIGMNAFIMRGVRVGHGAVIAANAVVTKDVPPYAIAGGNPARVIKYRFPQEVIDSLLRIQWWDWSDEKLRDNADLFGDVHGFVKLHDQIHQVTSQVVGLPLRECDAQNPDLDYSGQLPKAGEGHRR